MNSRKYKLWLCFNIILFLAINLVLKKSMFSLGAEDGFYSQVASGSELGGNNLGYIHMFRFLVASPFLYIYSSGKPAIFESVILLIFMLPILVVQKDNKNYFSQTLLIYMPYLFSYRAVLSMCGISYLFISIYLKKGIFFKFISAFLANLSSGVLLSWFMIVLWESRRKFMHRPWVLLPLALVGIGLSFSIIQKQEFFGSSAAVQGLPMTISSNNPILNTLARNTLLVSLYYGNYFRAILYAAALIFALLLLFYLFSNKAKYSHFIFFFIAGIPNFFFEGLGPMSFIMAQLLFGIFFFRQKRGSPHFENTDKGVNMSLVL